MPRKNSYVTVTDQFCGAGGSSQGARSAGVEVKMALNHWKLAIETHNTNFPETDHDCTDISACDPRRYPSTDILITSPECTNHSLAKGVKIAKKQMDLYDTGVLDPAAERSRATMWDVCRFAEYHSYNAIIVENVVDARKWVLFDAWLTAMYALGYNHKCVYLNSMHCHPTPQSRDRMYIVFWKKGNKTPMLDYMPAAFCPKCQKDVNGIQTWKKADVRHGKYKQQYVYCCPNDGSIVDPYYYAAFNCIDWSDPGTRIGDRSLKRFDKPFNGEHWLPLSPNTLKRIDFGLKKYGSQPMQIVNYSPGYAAPFSLPTGTVTTSDHHAVLNPFIVDSKQTSGVGHRTRAISETVQTIHTQPAVGVIMPFVFKSEHSHGAASGKVKCLSNALPTQTTRQSMAFVTPFVPIARGKSKSKSSLDAITTQSQMINHGVCVPPLLVDMSTNGKARPASEVLSTVTTGGMKNGIVTSEAFSSFIAQYYSGSNCTKHIYEEIGSVTTKDRSALVTYKTPKIEDCHYRMLKDYEIQLAMAFENDYVVLGTSKQKVKQLGNAVTPPAMEWIVKQVVDSLN